MKLIRSLFIAFLILLPLQVQAQNIGNVDNTASETQLSNVPNLNNTTVVSPWSVATGDYTARANYESVTLLDTRKTATADPNEYWYTNTSATATTSLTEPLRNSDGQYYEELVKNGGFDVDAEYSLGTGAAITGGVLRFTASTSNATQLFDFSSGRYYQVTYTISGYSAGTVRFGFGGAGTGAIRSANGTYVETIQLSSNNAYVQIDGRAAFTGDVDDFSIWELDENGNPTNVLDGGRRESQTNLQTYSEDYTDGSYSKTNGSVSGGATAGPDGATTADHFVSNDVGSASIILSKNFSGLSVSTLHTESVFVKAAGGVTWVRLAATNYDGSDETGFWFNLSTGETGQNYSNPDPPVVPVVVEADDGWYRASLGFVMGAADSAYTYELRLADSDGATSFTGDGTSGVYVVGGMLHEGMGPSERPAFEYIKTTSSGVTETENVSSSVVWEYGGQVQ